MQNFKVIIGLALLVSVSEPAAANFHVSGTFLYEDLPIDINGFQSPHPSRPCRLLDVKVIDNATQMTLATGPTDLNGSFSFDVTDGQVRNVAILALAQSSSIPNLNHYVTQWGSTSVHAYQGILVPSHNPNSDISMGAVTMHYRAGAEGFNLYDAVLDAADFIASMEGGVRPLGCRIRYTLDVSNDQAYFNGIVNMGGNYGYDDTILLHEFGHYIQSAYGNFSDNPGGSHYINDGAQDPRLSFGEGWPTFFGCGTREWAGCVHPQVYMNSTGDSATGHISFSYDVETYTAGLGASCEVAVTCCLWDQTDGDATGDNSPGVDDEPGYQMDRTFQESWDFTRDYLSQPPFSGELTYEDYHDIWIANVASPQTAELLQIEQLNQGIQYVPDGYEDDDSFGAAGTYHSFEDIGMGRTTHHTTWPQGDEDWIMFEGLAGVLYSVETLGMRDGADTYVEVQNALGLVVASNDNVAPPQPGGYNAFEDLRSRALYTPATTQDLYVRVRRSPNAPWGPVSLYGNWYLQIEALTAPASYPNIMVNPMFSFTITLDQNEQTTSVLEIRNTGTVDTLHFVLAEAGGPVAWVSENPTEGSVPPGGSFFCDMLFDATGLDPGTYHETLEIHSDDPNLTVRSLALNLTVNEVVGVGAALASRMETQLGANSPNPFGSRTSIPYTLSTAGHTVLTIYDLGGREIRRLVDGFQEARAYDVVWNGLDGDGRAAPSGIYFYRLDSPGESLTRKAVLTR